MRQRRDRLHIWGIDWITLFIYAALVGIGWLTLYAIHHEDIDSASVFSLNYPVGKQAVWIGISVFAMLLTQVIDRNFWRTFSFPIYGIAIILLLAVLVFGTEIKGARSWLTIGSVIRFQPSEFAKLATCLATASYLSSFSASFKNRQTQLMAFAFIAVPAFLILLQSDAGSAFVFSAFLIMFYRAGLSPTFFIVLFGGVLLLIAGFLYPPVYILITLMFIASLVLVQSLEIRRLATVLILLAGGVSFYGIGHDYNTAVIYLAVGILVASIFLNLQVRNFRQIGLSAGLLTLAFLISFGSSYLFNNVLEKHQQDRVNVWLQPEKCDPQGSLYNIMQSKMAIGSGGATGKGFLNGTMTKFNYVPEQSTDFVFCTIGEEFGFLGSMMIILLFVLLLNRLVIIAERQRARFPKYYTYGVVSLLFLHFFINIGMTLGLVPVIGIPLPFISYGGSSLLMFSIMLGILLKFDANRYQL